MESSTANIRKFIVPSVMNKRLEANECAEESVSVHSSGQKSSLPLTNNCEEAIEPSEVVRVQMDPGESEDQQMEQPVAKCDFCNKEFNKTAYRNRHVKSVHMLQEAKYSCDLCEKQYKQKIGLQRHITAVHLSEAQKYFCCEKCSYKSINKCHLKRHSMKVHQKGKDEVKKLNKPYKCTLCNAQYKHLSRLRYHERNEHQIGGPPKIIMKKKCPVCSFLATGPNAEQEIHNHFEVVHNIVIQIEKLYFSSIDTFFEWKKETEMKTVSVFTKRFSSSKEMIFRCHRSGVFKTKGSNQRNLKIIGSCKIGGYCPAMIKVKVNNDQSVTAQHILKHIGHKTELKHIRLTKEERDNIATQIASNIPHDEILKGVRDTLSNNNLKRIHLIKKKDLINIEQSLKLNSGSIKHLIDPESIEAWVHELQMSEDTALLAYKPQGITIDEFPNLDEDDFFLVFMTQAQMEVLKKYGDDVICIEGTHGLNNNNFQLYSILVLDECREGFPCSFMFTNRGDEIVLTKFIDLIKQCIGIVKPNVFMSDMEEGFYSAWESNMGPPKLRLFCTWHVLKAWRKIINTKIKNIEKREMVYNLLQMLLYELDVETFHGLLPQALNKMSLDVDTQPLRDYFEKYYVDKEQYKYWAYCHRTNAGINTNMSMENFNRILKHCHLRGKVIKRLDKNLCAVLHLIRDELFGIIAKIQKRKFVLKLENLKTRHKSSLPLDTEKTTRLSDDSWQVLSSTQNEFYTIKKVQHCTQCQLVCTHCKSCFHNFVCSCLDSAIRNNMCKHIHLVCRSMCNDGLQAKDTENLEYNMLLIDASEEERNMIEEITVDALSCKTEEVLSLDNLKKNLVEEFKAIVENSIQTEEECNLVKTHIKRLIPKLKATKSIS